MSDPTKQRMLEMLRAAFPLVQDADVVRRNAQDSGGMYWTWDAVEKILAWSDQREAASATAAAVSAFDLGYAWSQLTENAHLGDSRDVGRLLGCDLFDGMTIKDINGWTTADLGLCEAKKNIKEALAASGSAALATIRSTEHAAGFAEGREAALENVKMALLDLHGPENCLAFGEGVSAAFNAVRALKAHKP